ncbi:ribosomal protein RPL32 [Toxoplasma gondii]|nr:ribosomal protein RPL32 [Toxoplasma gondii]
MENSCNVEKPVPTQDARMRDHGPTSEAPTPSATSLFTMAPVSTVKRSIVKKRVKSFPRFQSDRYKRVKSSWRKPKGIDCRVRRKFKGTNTMPNIGYGSNKKTRHMLPNGFFKFLVSSPKDIELLLMHNTKFAAEIAHNISSRKRREILERADQLNVLVLNRSARLDTAEDE